MGDLNTDSQNDFIAELATQFDRLEIRASDETVLVTFTISWGTASSGTISVSSTPVTASASNTGTADHARFRHSTNAQVISNVSVATSGAIVTINTLNIESGKDVDLESCVFTSPATLGAT